MLPAYCDQPYFVAGGVAGASVAGGGTLLRSGVGFTTGSPLSRALFGGSGVMSGFGAGGAGGLSCRRSFGASFTLLCFFLTVGSAPSPTGALCTFCASFSSSVIG